MTPLAWQVGDIAVTKVVEIEGVVPPGGETFLLPDALPDAVKDIAWLAPEFATAEGSVRSSVQSFVVRTSEGVFVVDTGIGNGRSRSTPFYNNLKTDFLGRLETAGARRDEVVGVICTHLHVDHVGWNTYMVDGKWVPTFPNATYYVPRSDWDVWTSDPARIDTSAFKADSIDPIVEAGLWDPVGLDVQFAPGMRLLSTPGHTAGHVSVAIVSEGKSAIVTGDVFLHPAQIARPDWTSPLDSDPARAVATRRRFLETHADSDVLIFGTHFSGSAGGHIVRESESFRFVADYASLRAANGAVS